MTLKINGLAAAVTFAISTAVAAQAQPSTTQQTAAETQQTTSEPGSIDQSAAAKADQVTQATAADIKAGATVYDQKGASVGKVDSVDASGVVLNTGEARAKIPSSSFGKNAKGLVVGITKTDLEAQAKKAKSKS
jgi:hypothetical protein